MRERTHAEIDGQTRRPLLTSPGRTLGNLNKMPSNLTRLKVDICEGQVIMRRLTHSEKYQQGLGVRLSQK